MEEGDIMTTVMRQNEYLKKLNELNKEYGLAVKYDPDKGSYYLEDQVDYDFEYINCSASLTTNNTEFHFD